jgi:hypothetical protein
MIITVTDTEREDYDTKGEDYSILEKIETFSRGLL